MIQSGCGATEFIGSASIFTYEKIMLNIIGYNFNLMSRVFTCIMHI